MMNTHDRHLEDPPHARTGMSRATQVALALIALTAIAFGLLIATGFIRFTVEGRMEAPRVEVTGGSAPEIRVETGRVDVVTEERTVDVPRVEVERP